MRVSVIVPAYNEEKVIARCLRSLKAQTVPCEIVVCDNNSTDRTYEISRRYADKVVREKRQGPVHAINRGLKSAGGELLAVTGTDCVVPPDWIQRFIPHFRDPEVISCYGPVHPLEGRHRIYYALRNFAAKSCVRLGLWFVVLGANFITRRDVLEKVGYFDSDIQLFEENGFLKKTRKMGKMRFLSDNGILSSTRREDQMRVPSFTAMMIREWLRLTFSGRSDVKDFEALR